MVDTRIYLLKKVIITEAKAIYLIEVNNRIMAFHSRADNGPTLNAGLLAL